MVIAIGFFYMAADKDKIKIKVGDSPSIELQIGFTHCIRFGEALGQFVHFYGTRVEMKVCVRMQMKPGFIGCNLLRLIMLESVSVECRVNLKLLKFYHLLLLF